MFIYFVFVLLLILFAFTHITHSRSFLLQLELLQRQVTDLADTQNIAEDRTTRTKTEYAVLQTRYHMLEEQYREVSEHISSFLEEK